MIVFFNEIFKKAAENDRAFLARVRNADNPRLRYQIYDILAAHSIPLQEEVSLPFIVLGASIARSRQTADGSLTLGRALRLCYPDRDENDPIMLARLRRLLFCADSLECCRVLRAVLKLIEGRVEGQALNYEDTFFLVKQFDKDPQRARERLAEAFYRRDKKDAAKEAEADGALS